VALGVLAATATVFQMGSLGRIVDQVFLKEADLADVRDLMLLLLGAVLTRAALLLAQEVVAERGAAPDGSIIVATTSRFSTHEYRRRSKHFEVRSGLHPTLNEYYVPRRNRVYPWITSIALLDTFNVQLSWLAQAGSVQSRVIHKKRGPGIHVESTRPDLRRRNRSLRH
jgi:hypothetical protein